MLRFAEFYLGLQGTAGLSRGLLEPAEVFWGLLRSSEVC